MEKKKRYNSYKKKNVLVEHCYWLGRFQVTSSNVKVKTLPKVLRGDIIKHGGKSYIVLWKLVSATERKCFF